MMPDPYAAAPAMDFHRIQLLRSRIADEDYEVNPRQIADKIIDLEDALYRARPGPS